MYRALIAERPGSIQAFLADGAFWDIGTPADYLETALAIGREEGAPSVQVERGARVDASARVTHSVIWEDATIGAGAILDRCVVADGVRIPAGSRFTNCAIIQSGGELAVTEMGGG